MVCTTVTVEAAEPATVWISDYGFAYKKGTAIEYVNSDCTEDLDILTGVAGYPWWRAKLTFENIPTGKKLQGKIKVTYDTPSTTDVVQDNLGFSWGKNETIDIIWYDNQHSTTVWETGVFKITKIELTDIELV